MRTHDEQRFVALGAPLREFAVSQGEPEEPPAEVLARQLERLRPGDPFEGAEVVAAWRRATESSRAYRHRDTGTGHLLLALVEDDARETASLLGVTVAKQLVVQR
ncbi:Clp protease N-terminal domain-containing protein [Micromonospora sp. MA102]|uniref:Clp protease N-terminal domain-containing protein n=1 Tax=Micromonospora sp. MA102 TaxID=2952755 RepID=UPI0021CA8CD8|nr:Clp protease N-terminal domain-containing protein [Micromonospora sp. MA102]